MTWRRSRLCVSFARPGIPGVTVCSGSAEVAALAEAADLVVDGPDGVVALLGAIATALGG